MKSLQLRQRQKFGLIGVFSLGLITMAISFGRFMIYSVSNYDLGDNDGGMYCPVSPSSYIQGADYRPQPYCVQRKCAHLSSSHPFPA